MRPQISQNIQSNNFEEQLQKLLCQGETLAQIEQQSIQFNIPILEILVTLPHFYEALSKVTGALHSPIIPQNFTSSLKQEEYKHAIATGIMPIENEQGQLFFWHAPQGEQLHIFLSNCANDINFSKRIYLCEPEQFQTYLQYNFEKPWLNEAINALKINMPHYSASNPKTMKIAALVPLLMIWGFAMLIFIFPQLASILTLILSIFFFGWLIIRVLMCVFFQKNELKWQVYSDYPIYSILVPLYKEAEILPLLLKNLSKIDYPPSRLDVKFILERDDHETFEALCNMSYPLAFEVILAPNSHPRTKPKALMLAMPFVRGEFCVVYDAEDEPHPLQLQEAVQKFRRTDAAVLQAPLVVKNGNKNFITALFAADYCTLFDITLPTMARLNMPLPLGGTSNHFRTQNLRLIGGWDPFNVTEDADIGLRLAQFSLKASTITLGTFEAAPHQSKIWLKQRSRWYKGWCQTLYVHLTNPNKLYKNIGFIKFTILFLLLGSNLLSALIHPLALLYVAFNFNFGGLFWLFSGYALNAFSLIFAANLSNRALKLKFLAFIPIYWLMLSIAAYRAIFELLIRPYHWHKTPHNI